MKYVVNTSERRVENGEVIMTHGSHVVEAGSELEARLSFRKFPGERIESVFKQEEIKKKKNK
jgi:hypothetical protein